MNDTRGSWTGRSDSTGIVRTIRIVITMFVIRSRFQNHTFDPPVNGSSNAVQKDQRMREGSSGAYPQQDRQL